MTQLSAPWLFGVGKKVGSARVVLEEYTVSMAKNKKSNANKSKNTSDNNAGSKNVGSKNVGAGTSGKNTTPKNTGGQTQQSSGRGSQQPAKWWYVFSWRSSSSWL